MSESTKSGQEAPDKAKKGQPAEKPVSLHPLEFEEAVKGLLRVKSKNGTGRQKMGKGGRV